MCRRRLERQAADATDQPTRGAERLSDSASSISSDAASGPGPLSKWVTDWGSAVVDGITTIGDMTLFVWQMLVWMFTRLPRRGTMMINFYQVGVLSLPVVALTGTFIGMVLSVQSYHQFHMIGLESRLGAVINGTLVRELGPVLAATMLAGRVGSAMAANTTPTRCGSRARSRW